MKKSRRSLRRTPLAVIVGLWCLAALVALALSAQRQLGRTEQSQAVPVAQSTPIISSLGVKSGPRPLKASELPGDSLVGWKPVASPSTVTVTHDLSVNECASVHGALVWQQQGYISAFNTPAIHDIFTFSDATSARTAYDSLTASMDGCQSRSRTLQSQHGVTPDAKVTRTAITAGGTAYARRWTGYSGLSAAGPQTNHYYLAVHGNLVTVVQFTEGIGRAEPRPYDTTTDASALPVVVGQLSNQ